MPRGLLLSACRTIPSVVRNRAGQAGAVSSVSTALAPLLQQPQQHCTVSVLLVLYGLPRLLIGSIVAHELMHAYLRMRHVAGLPLQVSDCFWGRGWMTAGWQHTDGGCVPLP